MKKTLTCALIFCAVFGISAVAQESQPAKPEKFKKHLDPGAAFSYSVINNRKEIRGQYKPGINVSVNYHTRPWFSWSAEYSWFFPHNSSPGLIDINAWNAELNGNLEMGMRATQLKFRTTFGVSYLDWRGTYTGPTLIDKNTYFYGARLRQNWIAGNLGVGFGHRITDEFTGHIDFRIRFTSEKRDLVSISDTAFLFGVQWQPFTGGSATGDRQGNAKRKGSSGKKARVYKWLKNR